MADHSHLIPSSQIGFSYYWVSIFKNSSPEPILFASTGHDIDISLMQSIFHFTGGKVNMANQRTAGFLGP